MKKVSKIFLKENAAVLEKDEMKLILGGSTYRCCCGDNSCFDVNASNSNDAIWAISYVCYDSGGGCF